MHFPASIPAHTNAWTHIDNVVGCIINNQKVELFILFNPTIIKFHYDELYLIKKKKYLRDKLLHEIIIVRGLVSITVSN